MANTWPRPRGTLTGMDQQAVKRRVRIAVSVFFGVLTVAMCVLWVRSYFWRERIVFGTYGDRAIQFSHVL